MTQVRKKTNKDPEAFSEQERKEVQSIYARISQRREQETLEKCERAVQSGKYKSMEEARADIGMMSIIPIATKATCGPDEKITVGNESITAGASAFFSGSNATKEPLYIKMLALDWIIRDVMEISPYEFYTHYSTEKNKEFSLNYLINSIVENAPDQIKVEACFDTKNILFRFMYPELYEKQIIKLDTQVSGYQIFFCDEHIKSGLCRAGNTEKMATSKSFKAYGDLVDQVLVQAIEDVIFGELELESAREIFLYLANESALYYDKTAAKSKIAGINQVVEKRGFTSLLDYYYLKCGRDFQEKYCHEFHEVREMVKDKLPKCLILEQVTSYRMKRFPRAEETKESLFWLELTDTTDNMIKKTGYLLSDRQLPKETPFQESDFKKKSTVLTGAYDPDRTYTVCKLRDEAEVKSKMTWKGQRFSFTKTKEPTDLSYPVYVPEELRLVEKMKEGICQTSMKLPLSSKANPVAGRYQKIFRLGKTDLRRRHSPIDLAKIAIAKSLQEDSLTPESLAGIVKKYHLGNAIALMTRTASPIDTETAAKSSEEPEEENGEELE